MLCSLCVGNGVAVRSSQNNICDYLLPGKNLLLHTQLVDHVGRYVRKQCASHRNIFNACILVTLLCITYARMYMHHLHLSPLKDDSKYCMCDSTNSVGRNL